MPGTQDQDTVKPLSYTPIGKDDGTKPGIPPIPALRTSTPKQASLEGAENFTSDTLSPTASLGLGGSSDNGSEEHAYAELNLPLSEESVHGGWLCCIASYDGLKIKKMENISSLLFWYL